MNPSSFSPLRNFLVVAFCSGKLSGGREGHLSPLLRPPSTTSQDPRSLEWSFQVGGGRSGRFSTQLNTSEPSGKKIYILQLLILDKMTTATKINKTNEPHLNQEDVAPGPFRLLPAVDSTEHGCGPWFQVPPAFLLLWTVLNMDVVHGPRSLPPSICCRQH